MMARARRRRTRNSRTSSVGDAWYWFAGVILLVVTCVVVAGYAYLRWGIAAQRPVLEAESLCPEDGAYSVTVVLLDSTDALPEITKLEVLNYLTDVAETVPPYGLLQVRILDPAVPGGSVKFSKCNPGDGSNLSELVADPRRERIRWLNKYSEPVQRALQGSLAPSGADVSPLMETIQRISVEQFGGRKRREIPKSLIVVSDMIENAPGYSQYQGDLSYDRFRKTASYKKLRTDLNGARVFIRYVQRFSPAQNNSGEHIDFWLEWIRDNNGTPVEAKKLQGAG